MSPGRRLERYLDHAVATVRVVGSLLLEVPRCTSVIQVRHPDAA
jgi:hypothetical protein